MAVWDIKERYDLARANQDRKGNIGLHFLASTTSLSNTVNEINVSVTGDAVDFGDLTLARYGAASVASATRAVFGGGYIPGAGKSNTIDYVTFSAKGNAADFGDLTNIGFNLQAGVSDHVRGIFGPRLTPGLSNTLDVVSMATTGNAIDFGDPAITGGDMTGTANGHGGLS